MLTRPALRKIFDYDPAGFLIWKTKMGQRTKIGERAGTFGSDYAKVKLNGRGYLLHRLIFLWHRGFLPKGLDHRDRNVWNNKIGNLRPATQSENCRNTARYKNNKTGLTGVSWCSRTKRYHAVIGHKGKTIFLGSFKEALPACVAYNKMAKKLHGRFAVLNAI